MRFKGKLQEAISKGEFGPVDVFEDQPNRTPYKLRGYETPEAMSKIHIRKPDGKYEDLANRSDVVKALQAKSMYRVYARTDEVALKIQKLAEGL